MSLTPAQARLARAVVAQAVRNSWGLTNRYHAVGELERVEAMVSAYGPIPRHSREDLVAVRAWLVAAGWPPSGPAMQTLHTSHDSHVIASKPCA